MDMADKQPSPKPTEDDVVHTGEEEKNVDRDGRERQPNQQTDQK